MCKGVLDCVDIRGVFHLGIFLKSSCWMRIFLRLSRGNNALKTGLEEQMIILGLGLLLRDEVLDVQTYY